MNAVDCNPVNTEHHWLCMLQTLPYRLNALKKLNWCYRLWTLPALNADIGYGLTLNTVYTESYWHIILNWHYTELYMIKKEQTAQNATHNLIHTTKHLKSHHDIPHHTATTISHHTLFFTTPFCTTSHSVIHPGHRHSTSYNIPFHVTPYNKCVSSVASFNSALKTHLLSSGLCLLYLCAWSWVPLVSCVCVFRSHSTSQVL